MSKSNQPNKRTTTPAKFQPKEYELSALVETRQAEGLDIKWHGEPILTVPHPSLWSDVTMETAESGENAGTLRLLCGDEAYDHFVEVTGLGAQIVWDAVKDFYGATVGESLASSQK